MQCTKKLRFCRQCKHEFDKFDTSTHCPECGENRRCQKKAVAGWKRCKHHGGPNPPHFYGMGFNVVDGAGSRFPLFRLASKYKEMMENGRLLSNRQAVDLIDKRVVQLLERIDVEDAPDRVAKLYTLWERWKRTSDGLKKLEVRQKLDSEFEKAYHDYAAWGQVFEALDLRRKMVESEVKVAKDLKAMMTAEEGYQLVAKIFAIIEIVEDDPSKLKRYAYEFAKLTGDDKVVEADNDALEAVVVE